MFYSLANITLRRKDKSEISFRRRETLTGTLKGEVYAVSMELGFSEVLVPEILRLRGDLSAGTSGKDNTIKNPKFTICNLIVKLFSLSTPPQK